MKTPKLTLALLALCFAASSLLALTPVGSREYKLMLDPALFAGSSPATAVSQFWNDLEPLIENNLSRTATGTFALTKSRTVRFYDTPLTCVLNNHSYSFRERVENSAREVTLKFRSPDRYISQYEDLSGTETDASTKFEEDISAPFASKYSNSTTQGISDTKNLNKMDDPIRLYPGLLSYGFDDTEAIAIVGNLTVEESVYEGTEVDLGNENGAFSLTLWYKSGITTVPVIAEISFKHKDAAEDYSQNVVTRSKTLFELMQTMSGWLSPSSLTKTAYVYSYDPAFCQ